MFCSSENNYLQYLIKSDFEQLNLKHFLIYFCLFRLPNKKWCSIRIRKIFWVTGTVFSIPNYEYIHGFFRLGLCQPKIMRRTAWILDFFFLRPSPTWSLHVLFKAPCVFDKFTLAQGSGLCVLLYLETLVFCKWGLQGWDLGIRFKLCC